MSRGALLVAHGSQDRAGNEQFLALCAQVGAAPGFLGQASPGIVAAVGGLAAQGVTEIAVLPVFLFPAGHVKRDIPAALAEAARRHPGAACRLGAPLGTDPDLVRMAAAGLPPGAVVLLAGPGSSDPGAGAGLAEVAERLRAEADCAAVVPAACEGGALDAAFLACLEAGARRVMVLPYFLFRGALLDRVAARAARWQAEHGPVAVHLVGAQGLGAHPRFPNLIAHRLTQV